MKRNLLPKSLKRGLLAVPAAALMLGASQAAQVGLNFQDNYAGVAYAPVVAGPAFGLDLAQWFNVPSVFNSENGGGVSSSAIAPLPGGGEINVAWSCVNTYSIFNPIPTNGDEQVIYGYLDDTGTGYSVTLTGFRGFASAFKITTIASTDNGASFEDAVLTTSGVTNNLQYLNNYISPVFNSGLAGVSTVSSEITTLAGNDSVTIKGLPRNGTSRSCLAGILIEYTPGNNNPPLIEVNPQSPVGNIFPGGSFVLKSLASGSPPLNYQWRKGGTDIPGANFPNYTNNSAVIGDSGDYDVIVTNAINSTTSTVAQVTIQNVTAPLITKSPLSQSLYQGYPAIFSVEATGGQLAYQWKSNGVTISEATNSTYSIASTTATSAATYSVEVSNPVGPTATASATLAVKVPTPGSYEEVVSQTKPLVWFRDSETTVPLIVTGSAANNGSTGTADNGVAKFYTTFQQPGAIVADTNKSASFDGAQAIDVPYDAALNTADFTVEVWAKTATIANGARSPLYNRGAAAGDGWLFFANNGSPVWTFRTYTGATRNNINSTAPVVSNAWTHLVGVYDSATTTTRFYVDGVEQGTGVVGPCTPNSSIPLRIGAAGNDTGAAGNLAWSGGVDEVALYNTVLTPADILSHFENGTNAARVTPYSTLVLASAPVGYWRLNDPAGPIPPAPSNSGTLGVAWNGAYAGDILPGVAGPVPPTYPGFEPTNHAVSMTNGFTSAPTLLLGNDVTVTCWLKRADDATTGDLSWPVWLGDGGMHLNEATSTTPGELRYHWKGGNWGWSSGLYVPAEVWTFCAMVVEPTKATFYMSDGTTLRSAVNEAAHTPMGFTSPLGFGGNQPGRGDRNYIGIMDESTVYDRALTQSEITALFMVGTGAPLTVGLVPGGTIVDSKPVGAPSNGANYLTTWLASSPGTPSRTGVERFTAATNSQITVPASPEFDSATGTFTFWVRVPAAAIPGPGEEGAMLMDRRTDNGMVIVLNDAGNIFVQCAGGANSLTSPALLADDVWHNIAVTYNQANGAPIEIFVDGVSSIAQNNSAAWTWPTAQPVEIGRSHDGYWKRYDGQLDDFRIYNRVLTQGEIASIYSSDALVDNAALKLRFNFSTAGTGNSVTWPFGTLLSSPVLGPSAIWTPVPGAQVPIYPITPSGPARFFRATP